jgi:hypothetical protein
MTSYTINENYIATDLQQEFSLKGSFTNDCIEVYLNDLLQVFGETQNYTTIPEEGVVVFNAPLRAGDFVSIANNIENNDNVEIVSSLNVDRPNSVFKKYNATANKFKFNNKYTISIKIGAEEFHWEFNTRMTPAFSTVKKVLEDCGEFLRGFTEEYIGAIIHRNSVEVVDLINELANAADAISNVTVQQDNEGYYTTEYKAVNNWVKFKTEIDLIYARYYGVSLNYGSVTKSIGDINIEKSTDLPLIDELLKRLQRQFDLADQTIRNAGVGFFGSAVKGATRFQYSERGTF